MSLILCHPHHSTQEHIRVASNGHHIEQDQYEAYEYLVEVSTYFGQSKSTTYQEEVAGAYSTSVNSTPAATRQPTPEVCRLDTVPFTENVLSSVNRSGTSSIGPKSPTSVLQFFASRGGRAKKAKNNSINQRNTEGLLDFELKEVPNEDEQKCFQCGITKTPVWRRDAERRRLCNSCGLYRKLTGLKRPVELNRGTQQRRKRGIEKAKN